MSRPARPLHFSLSVSTLLLLVAMTIFLSVFTPAGALRAEPPAAPRVLGDKPAADAAPSTAPLDATDVAGLQAHLGENIEVKGMPTKAGHNTDGSVLYLDFGPAHQALTLVFFLKDIARDTSGAKPITEDDLKPYVGKPITVQGQLKAYKGDVQIIVRSLEQIHAEP